MSEFTKNLASYEKSVKELARLAEILYPDKTVNVYGDKFVAVNILMVQNKHGQWHTECPPQDLGFMFSPYSVKLRLMDVEDYIISKYDELEIINRKNQQEWNFEAISNGVIGVGYTRAEAVLDLASQLL